MFIENFKFAVSGIWANKVRSFLTMLGIIIGVGSVITLTSIGEGIRGEFSNQIESIGSNLILAISGDIDGISNEENPNDGSVIYTQPQETSGFSSIGSSMALTITQKDIEDVKNEVPNIESISGMNISSAVPMYEGKRIIGPMVLAFQPEAFDIFNGESFEMLAGNFFEEDINQRQVIIGEVTKNGVFGEDFPANEALGKQMTLFGESFEIIGVYKEIENESSSEVLTNGNFFADSIILPFSTNAEMSGEDNVFRIIMNAKTPEDVSQVKQDVKNVLERNHGNSDDFSVVTEEEILGVFDSFFGILTSAVAGIAAISLIVGGIGIMNIMLVSVSERTREIGVRKSIGATSFNVLGQFLIEAVCISILGGVMGVGLSYFAGWGIENYFNLPTEITMQALIVVFCISASVGIIFGISPAIKASRKSPIEALRHE